MEYHYYLQFATTKDCNDEDSQTAATATSLHCEDACDASTGDAQPMDQDPATGVDLNNNDKDDSSQKGKEAR